MACPAPTGHFPAPGSCRLLPRWLYWKFMIAKAPRTTSRNTLLAAGQTDLPGPLGYGTRLARTGTYGRPACPWSQESSRRLLIPSWPSRRNQNLSFRHQCSRFAASSLLLEARVQLAGGTGVDGWGTGPKAFPAPAGHFPAPGFQSSNPQRQQHGMLTFFAMQFRPRRMAASGAPPALSRAENDRPASSRAAAS